MFAGVEGGAGAVLAGGHHGADGVGGEEEFGEGLFGGDAGGAEQGGGVHQAGEGGEEDGEVGLVHELGEAGVGAEVLGGADDRQCGPVARQDVLVPAVVDVRLVRADHRGRVHDAAGEEGGAVPGGPGDGLPGAVGGVGAEVDQGAAGEGGRGVGEDVVHRRVVGEAEQGQRARLDGLARGRRALRPVGDDAVGAGGGPVPDGDLVAGGEEGTDHRPAHRAEADHRDRGGKLSGGVRVLLVCVHGSMLWGRD